VNPNDFLDVLRHTEKNPYESFRELLAMTHQSRQDLRLETVRRLAAEELPALTAVAVLSVIGVEPIVPELVRFFRSETISAESRAATMILLRQTTFDLIADIERLDRQAQSELAVSVIELHNRDQSSMQRGTPFEAVSSFDAEDDDLDLDGIVDDLVEAFLESPEAAEATDSDELRSWVGTLIGLGVEYGFGSPATWNEQAIEEIVCELMPKKITLESANDARPAIPAFRLFFRWASQVAFLPHAAMIDAVLKESEPDFPSMMMDQRRFGMAKSFMTEGTAAGFDMSTEEGLQAFQLYWNGQRALAPRLTTPNKKQDAAKKRKAKMAKLSRRRNRRKK
jgi:hypothetical protein